MVSSQWQTIHIYFINFLLYFKKSFILLFFSCLLCMVWKKVWSNKILKCFAVYSHTVPACACDSNTMIDASSRLIDVDRWDNAGICNNSSNTNSNSSCVRSWDL